MKYAKRKICNVGARMRLVGEMGLDIQKVLLRII